MLLALLVMVVTMVVMMMVTMMAMIEYLKELLTHLIEHVTWTLDDGGDGDEDDRIFERKAFLTSLNMLLAPLIAEAVWAALHWRRLKF